MSDSKSKSKAAKIAQRLHDAVDTIAPDVKIGTIIRFSQVEDADDEPRQYVGIYARTEHWLITGLGDLHGAEFSTLDLIRRLGREAHTIEVAESWA